MRLARIALPLLLLSSLPACAARGAASAPLAEVGTVTLLNRDEMVRLMASRFTPGMRSVRRDGFVVMEVALDAGGAVTSSRYQSAGGGLSVNTIAHELAPRLRFSPPPAAGTRVLVRLAYDRDGRPDVFIEG